jgi:hypothetical protein
MPLRINLLAEAQALEEMRRKDPAKRAIWAGAFAIAMVLAWSSSLQVKVMMARQKVSQVEAGAKEKDKAYKHVLDSQKALADTKVRLAALQRLAQNRFLLGNLMNAVQQTTLDDVQLVHLRLDQDFVMTDAVKPKTSGGKTVPGKPATVTEKVLLTLDARDNSSTPGDMVNKFQQRLAEAPYFQAVLGETNEFRLANTSQPQSDPDGKQFVLFTFQCRFPEKTR